MTTHGATSTPQTPVVAGEDLDSSLARRVGEGSAEALAELYDRYAGTIYATAIRRLHDRSMAEEVVQDAFLALWNRVELFDPARGSLRAWLLTIARNRAIDELRRLDRRGSTLPFSAFDDDDHDGPTTAERLTTTGRPLGMARPETGPEVALAAGEDRASVRTAIAALGPAERSVILLAYGEHLSQAEIAIRLGWPIGTVKTRTRRALRRLREGLGDPAPAVAIG